MEGGRTEQSDSERALQAAAECKRLVTFVVHNGNRMRVITDRVVETDLVAGVEARRVRHTPVGRPGRLGQIFTPMAVASLLSGMFEVPSGRVRLLDPGAGVGSLTAALVGRATAEKWDVSLDVTAPRFSTDTRWRSSLPESRGRPKCGSRTHPPT